MRFHKYKNTPLTGFTIVKIDNRMPWIISNQATVLSFSKWNEFHARPVTVVIFFKKSGTVRYGNQLWIRDIYSLTSFIYNISTVLKSEASVIRSLSVNFKMQYAGRDSFFIVSFMLHENFEWNPLFNDPPFWPTRLTTINFNYVKVVGCFNLFLNR